jgi:hypothetical protein
VTLLKATTPAPAATGNGRPDERFGGRLDLPNTSPRNAKQGRALARLVVEIMAISSVVVEIMAIKRFAIDPKVVLTITPLPALASNRTAS